MFSERVALVNQTVSSVVKNIAIGAGGLGSIPGSVRSDTALPTALFCCNISSKLCCPGAKPRRWASLLVIRFGVISRV